MYSQVILTRYTAFLHRPEQSDRERSDFVILPNINHFGIFSDAVALKAVIDWLRALPAL